MRFAGSGVEDTDGVAGEIRRTPSRRPGAWAIPTASVLSSMDMPYANQRRHSASRGSPARHHVWPCQAATGRRRPQRPRDGIEVAVNHASGSPIASVNAIRCTWGENQPRDVLVALQSETPWRSSSPVARPARARRSSLRPTSAVANKSSNRFTELSQPQIADNGRFLSKIKSRLATKPEVRQGQKN